MREIDCKESSNLHWARYYRAANVLEVDFKNAAGQTASTYAYRSFTPDDYERFQSADSKGRHFAYTIRPLYDKGGARFGLCQKLAKAANDPLA